MKSRTVLSILIFTAMLSSGCARSGPIAGPDHAVPAKLFGSSESLRKKAEAARDAGNLDLAYRYLSLIQLQNPDSPESKEAFPEAARLFKHLYDREIKLQNWNSVFFSSEPYFVFRWLEDQFRGEEFPQGVMDLLFLHSRYSLFRSFETYAAKRAAFVRWTIRVEKDNGIIESVSAIPRSS